MFKSVTYEGFDNHPELRAVCEGVTGRLESRRILPAKRITLRWELSDESPAAPGLHEVVLEFTDLRIGTERVGVTAAQLEDRDAAVDAIIRRRMTMLDRYMDGILDGFERDAVPEGVA